MFSPSDLDIRAEQFKRTRDERIEVMRDLLIDHGFASEAACLAFAVDLADHLIRAKSWDEIMGAIYG